MIEPEPDVGTDQIRDAAEVDDLPGIARDPAAFEVFYRLHVATVTRFVARRVADPHTVADLTAEVFLAVIGSAHTYQKPDRVLARGAAAAGTDRE